jgi:peptide/nickel transport system substrate-binding protein
MKKVIWYGLSMLLVAAMLIVSCNSSTTTTSTIPTLATSTTSTMTTTATNVTTTTSAAAAVTVTTTSTGNWWDSLGIPQFGGEINLSLPSDITGWDPYQGMGTYNVFSAYMEQLFSPSWTENPTIQNYQLSFWDSSYAGSGMVQSWEFTNPSTLVLNLQQGIYWQDLAPSFGREFTATDVVYDYDRMMGLGDGFTAPSFYWLNADVFNFLTSVKATGNFTVTMNWSISNPEDVLENMLAPGPTTSMEDPDAVAAYTTSNNLALSNWHNAIGTGPFILQDFVDDTSVTFVKNPNYWGYDERYPQNQLPYVNQLNFLVITQTPTALAAMRTGKIDVLDNVTTANVQGMQQTNPTILVASVPGASAANTIDPRNDLAPFNNLNVRIALQEGIDLPTIAKTYYNGVVSPDPSTMTSNYMTGWGYPYSQWPASLQAEYAYNPTNAKALLVAAGYPNGFNTNIVVSSDSDLTLLQIVQSYFTNINVNMSITTMDPASWSSYVTLSHKNLALAMRANGSLGFSYSPFIQLTRYLPGNNPNYMMINDPVFNAAQPDAMAATTINQVKQIVQATNEEVAQQHYVISLLPPPTYSFYQPWLKGFDAQYCATWGWGGPQLLYFWDARFWIDQTLKS